MTFHIDAKHNGRTVLSFLKSVLKISTSALAGLKRDEIGILVNGQHVTVRYTLKENDVLFVNEKDSPEDSNTAIIPVDLPIRVLFENDDIMLIDKPANMPTHPSHDHTDDTLANAVAYHYRLQNLPFVFRPIGRLDRNTSGISLIAKNPIAASYLYYARKKEMIRKKYIAILVGRIDLDDGYHVIDNYIKRQTDTIIIRCIGNENEEGALRAITHWRVLYTCDQLTVVEAIPITGRTHQLRVHFAHIGHPILGDDVYGTASEYIDRHALHAAFLSFPIPYNESSTHFLTYPPEDMRLALINICGQDLCQILDEKLLKPKG